MTETGEALSRSTYCIKCRTHTQDLDSRQEEITSKGKPRTVTKAICAICSKRKNRFSATAVKNETVPVPVVEKAPVVKTQRLSKKQLQELLQKYLDNEEAKK